MSNTSTTSMILELPVNHSEYYNLFGNIYKILVKITNPYNFLVACIGLITNTSTIVLLSKSFVTKNLRHKWTLIALAISDLILNISLLIRILQDASGRKIPHLYIIISFLSHLAELLSPSFTVLFTIQRYTAVRYPFQAALQKRSSPIIPLVLILLTSIIFCTILISKNDYNNYAEELKLSWFIADALFSFIIPFSLILIFNILIVNLIREQGRSLITVQSTLKRSDKHRTKRKHHDSKRSNPPEESYSISQSCGCSPTSHPVISEIDINDKENANNILVKYDGTNITIEKNKSFLSYHNSEETDCLANEICVPLSTMEKMNSEVLSDDQRSSIHQCTQLQRDSKKKKRETSSNSYESRDLACLSNDVDCISPHEGQTTQSIRVTRMLVLVSTCFLILNAPAHICLIAAKIISGDNTNVESNHAVLDSFQQATNLTDNQLKNYVFIPTHNDAISEKKTSSSHEIEHHDDKILVHLLYMAILVTQSISYTSYSINFFLYSYSGVAFRTSLRQVLNKLRKH